MESISDYLSIKKEGVSESSLQSYRRGITGCERPVLVEPSSIRWCAEQKEHVSSTLTTLWGEGGAYIHVSNNELGALFGLNK